MRATEARVILAEAGRWRDEGVITTEQHAALIQRYSDVAREADGGGTSLVLHALGGLVLGAAAIAFVVLLDMSDEAAAWALFLEAIVLAAVGVALVLALPRSAFGDAVLVAALVPLVPSAINSDENLLAFAAAFAVPAGLAAWRRDVVFVPPLAAVAFATGSAFALGSYAGQGNWTLSWLAALAAATAVVGWRAGGGRTGWEAASGALAIALAIAGVVFYFDYDLNLGDGGPEILVGVILVVILAAAVPFRRRGLVVGATVAFAIDAIVFAFDVGGLVFGVVTLLAVSGGLLAAAGAARRWLRA